jgi:hypothetical protein
MDELRRAIQNQAEDLKKRVDWLQRMIDRNTQVALNAQGIIEGYRADLQAANLALDGLRSEYRKLIENGNNSKE